MADLIIDEDILRQLEAIAEREHRPVNDILRTMVEKYPEPPITEQDKLAYPDWLPRTAGSPDYDPIEDFIGMIDADITDASTTVRESMEDYYRKKYADSD